MKKSINQNTRKTITVSGEKVTAPIWLLNQFSIWGTEAADHMAKEGLYAIADEARGEAHEIYCQLESMGVYDD